MDVLSAASARLKPWRLSRLVQSHLTRQYQLLNAPATPAVYRPTRPIKNHSQDQRACFHYGRRLSGRERADNAALPRQVTFHIPQPRNTDDSKILSAIKEFSSLEEEGIPNDAYTGEHPAVVILATPSYIHWLEDSAPFIPKILQAITARSNGHPQDVQVVCACVDRLAPDPASLRRAHGGPEPRGAAAQEGFSILHGDCEVILPGLKFEESHVTPTESLKQSAQRAEASLTVQTGRGAGVWDITLPLANTLFTNGRHSTLLVSRWHVSADGAITQTVPQRNQSSIRIDISAALGTGIGGGAGAGANSGIKEAAAAAAAAAAPTLPHAHIPATPLTAAYPIGSGLGNIVRTIVYPGAEGEQPASRELEARVLEFLKNPAVSTPTIPVWALIIPERAVGEVTTGGESSVVDSKSDDIGTWISKGAIFCRVLSGGGGWGVKAGLLSLDPETAYGSSPDARSDPPAPAFLSSNVPLSQDITALGNIAEPGSHIQFFTAALDSDADVDAGDSPSQFQSQTSPRHPTAVFGTTPSTIDNLPLADPADASREAHSQQQHHHQVISRAGHFGFVSEKGMYIEHRVADDGGAGGPEQTQASHTKIDLPFSYFYMDKA